MKIECLERNGRSPYRNSFLLHGENRLSAGCTMVIDPGTDSLVHDHLESRGDDLPEGRNLFVMITRNLYEQIGAAQTLRRRFGAQICAYGSPPGIDRPLLDGEIITLGREVLEVLYTPGDTLDAMCLYSPTEKILFSGDSGLLRISRSGGTYINAYVEGLFKIASREIRAVYSSFDEPVTSGCAELIISSLRNVCRSTVVEDALAC